VHRYRASSRRRKTNLIAAAVTAVFLVAALVFFVRSSLDSPARPAGLIQAGDSKTNCIYARLGAPLRDVEQATGINYDCIETFSDVVPNWSGWVSPWLTQNGYGYNTWVAADPTRRQIILTQGLIPTSAESDPEWTAKCAAGDYNAYARELARNLVRTGFGYSVIRLGAEMNGTWNADSLGSTMTEWHQWGQCFAQEVQTMRMVPDSHFLFDWDINANYRNIPLADFYPGNAYVDIIGIDAYDVGAPGLPLPPVSNPARWAELAAQPEGLNLTEAFAAAHGKPLSFPEWATVMSQGDDANYVRSMGAFIATHDVAFQSWFDVGDDGIFQLSPTQAPLSLAAYKKAFG
jgi:hypothetical protein